MKIFVVQARDGRKKEPENQNRTEEGDLGKEPLCAWWRGVDQDG